MEKIMILNINQINKLNKLDKLPTKEKFRANWDKEDFYGDRYHNCANHYYGLGDNYYSRCVRANLGKHVKQVIFKLKNNSIYKHNHSFRKAVDFNIKKELIDNVNIYYFRWNEFYVDENGFVQDIKNHPKFPKKQTYSKLPDSPEMQKLFEVTDGLTDNVIRENGIHYYITKKYCETLLFKPWQTLSFTTSLTKEDTKKIQLNKVQLKKHGLINIWK